MKINKNSTKQTNDFAYEVKEKCGVISTQNGGWSLELRYISWNGRPPKYDIRPWKVDENGEERCGKGITLTGEELEALGNLIAQ